MITSQDDGTWFTWLEPVTTSPKTLCTGIIWSFRWIIIWLFACPAPPPLPRKSYDYIINESKLNKYKKQSFHVRSSFNMIRWNFENDPSYNQFKNKHMTLKVNFLTCFDMLWFFLTFFDFFWLLKRELCKKKLPPTWSEPHIELTDF